MSTLKMYFCIVSETRADNITVHRELNSIYTLWNNENSDDKVGIIHIGFIRPKTPCYEEIQHFHGNILVSASVKWSLPTEYNTSKKTVYKGNQLTLFQLLTGFGYNIEKTDDYLNDEPSNDSSLVADSNHTIASAALEVLESLVRPMTKEEIFGYIIERNLFQFGAKKPINVLNVELNRHCEGTEYRQKSSTKLFIKHKSGLFSSINTSGEYKINWFDAFLAQKNSDSSELIKLNISNESGYLKLRVNLSKSVVNKVDLFRFDFLKDTIDNSDIFEVLEILPYSVLCEDIETLGFSVRINNVFKDQKVRSLSMLVNFRISQLLSWPKFGLNSLKDLCSSIFIYIEDVFRLHLEQNWIDLLQELEPGIYSELAGHSIFDDMSYLLNRNKLSTKYINSLDLIRFKLLKDKVDHSELDKILDILPSEVLNTNLNILDLPVRTVNAFNIQNIYTLNEAKVYRLVEMLKWPNFGKKSAIDLCNLLLAETENILNKASLINNQNDKNSSNENSSLDEVSKVSLKQHFENSISKLKENARQVIEYRTGYQEPVKTLEEVGVIIGVTRERIRQIQKKNIEKILTTEYWDDCIAIKIGELLVNREQPLYLEMLEIEDNWFTGFIGNYQHLAAIIELFSENEIRLIKIDGAMVISRIHQDDWDTMISSYRKSLRSKANEHTWTKSDITLTLKASLDEKGASELYPLLWGTFSEMLVFEKSTSEKEILISYGKTLVSATLGVLHQAESPLHFSVIADRVCKQFGKKVTAPQVNSCLHKVGAKLFDRGVYGLPHFNPISEGTCQHLRVVVETLTYNGPLMKQWHATEFLKLLQEKFPALPKDLNQYILNMVLESSEKLTYLNKNVWARTDSGQSSTDRVDMADAFTKILEDSGRALKGVEIKEKLREIRGVHEDLQLQPTDRMILVAPDTWGLIDRDIGGTEESNNHKLDAIFNYLSDSQKGIHVSEVSQCLSSYQLDPNETSSYALLNLAQRDNRFFLGRAMFLGLSDWGEDVRRINYSQAIRKVLEGMYRPMTIVEIHAQVEALTELEVDNSVTNLLIKEGGKYNASSRLWENNNK
ncbi:MAG: DNA-directed RNA polymerase subunit alpha C-terminal domain-containing protein [Alteromonadaceae bacterium]|jgi:hypothetical protein